MDIVMSVLKPYRILCLNGQLKNNNNNILIKGITGILAARPRPTLMSVP